MHTSINPVLSHAVRGSSTSAPSGRLLSATAAAENTGFCFLAEAFDMNANRPTTKQDYVTFSLYEILDAPLCWRILIQVCAMAMDDYRAASSTEDKTICKQKLLEVLIRINQKAQMTSPELLQFDMRPPTAEWDARNVTGNWCTALTKQLTLLFMSV